MKRQILRITFDKTFALGFEPRWKITFPDGGYEHHATKAVAVAAARAHCHYLASKEEPVQLVVHGKDGRIQFENTYPRSSDPRRHRG